MLHFSKALCKNFENNVFHTARLKCITAIGSWNWKSGLPIDHLSKLSNIDYQISTRINLGLPPSNIMPTSCPYCKSIIGYNESTSLHFLCCPYLKGREVTARHDAVQHVIELFCSRAGLFTRRYDHSNRHSNNNEQLHNNIIDTYIEFQNESYDIDYVITHPTAKSYVNGSSRQQLYAASLADTRKHNHHYDASRNNNINNNNTSNNNSNASSTNNINNNNNDQENNINSENNISESKNSFLSFSVETYGGLHESARKIINGISVASQGHGIVFPRFDILYSLRYSIACAIQRGNSRILRAGLNASAKLNAKYTHECMTVENLENSNNRLFNHVTKTYNHRSINNKRKFNSISNYQSPVIEFNNSQLKSTTITSNSSQIHSSISNSSLLSNSISENNENNGSINSEINILSKYNYTKSLRSINNINNNNNINNLSISLFNTNDVACNDVFNLNNNDRAISVNNNNNLISNNDNLTISILNTNFSCNDVSNSNNNNSAILTST